MKRMLGPLLKLLLLLTTVSHGTATSCRSPEGEISAQYYGALGQSAYVHLINNSVDHSDLQLEVFFKCENIFTYKQRNKITRFFSGRNGQFLKNGTLRLDNLTKNHSGVYSIEEFLGGTGRGKRHITLTIQAPVSPPKLFQHCQPHGEIRAWCSSTGEPPQYSWTLNDRPLDGGVAFLSNETQTVILKRDIPGSITCTVSNHVSKERTTQKLLTCRECQEQMVVPVALGSCSVLLAILLGTWCCLYKKKQKQPKRSQRRTGDT
ncbi:uncharacterized protein LOC133125305 [Conger conger]|uniref:uncharacterized protein LOC133125305 n=1 Tax=Conger conger TaxID=82655 RepID=UPI002A5A2044|nr:uncharacterized protein LOC133125305 [Conger conger]